MKSGITRPDPITILNLSNRGSKKITKKAFFMFKKIILMVIVIVVIRGIGYATFPSLNL